METINYLLGYKDLKIYQDTEMFNFSLDSVLLPNFVTLNQKIQNVLDIGCGNAVIPLILTQKTNAMITGVEIQPESFALAEKSVAYNKLEDRIKLYNMDICEYAKMEESDTFDVITCNPPFFKLSEKSHLNESPYKIIARHEVKLNLDSLFGVARKLLKNNGVVSIVHRPERLVEIIEAMKKNNIEPKRIQFVYPGTHKEANILLIEGSKNGKPGIKLLQPLYTHNEDGSYTEEVKAYFS